MVGNNDMFIDIGNGIDIIKHTTKNGVGAYLEQWLGKILGEFPQTGGVAGGNNDGFHEGN
jgi:hypothetical protein